LPDMTKVTPLRGQKGIVPASYEQDGRFERLQSVLTIDIHPKGVSIRMLNPILEEGNVCTGSSPVRVNQWEIHRLHAGSHPLKASRSGP